MMSLQANTALEIFDPGDSPTTISSLSSQINHLKERFQSDKDWLRNAPFGIKSTTRLQEQQTNHYNLQRGPKTTLITSTLMEVIF